MYNHAFSVAHVVAVREDAEEVCSLAEDVNEITGTAALSHLCCEK